MLLQFMGRPAGRDEMHLIEIKAPVRGPRHDEMTAVNRIKRTAKERDAARMMFCGGAVRLRGGQRGSGEAKTELLASRSFFSSKEPRVERIADAAAQTR
jgi:hypothetical protein